MNKLILTYGGGMPHTQNDLKYLQDGVIKNFGDIMKALNSYGTHIILWGLEDNGSDTITEGALYNKDTNEIYYMPESHYASLAPRYICYTKNYNADGYKLFKTGANHDTYLNSTCYLDTAASGVEWSIDYDDTNVIKRYSPVKWGNWGTLDIASNGYNGYLKYRRMDTTGMLEIKGYIDSVGASVSTVVAVLPVGYRPNIDVDKIIANVYDPGTSKLLTIKSDGGIILFNPVDTQSHLDIIVTTY